MTMMDKKNLFRLVIFYLKFIRFIRLTLNVRRFTDLHTTSFRIKFIECFVSQNNYSTNVLLFLKKLIELLENPDLLFMEA